MNRLKITLPTGIRYIIIAPYIFVALVFGAVALFIATRLIAFNNEGRFQNQLNAAVGIVSEQVLKQEQLRLEVGRHVANTIGLPEAAAQQDWQSVFNFVNPIMATSTDIDHILIVDTQGQEVRRFFRSPTTSEVAYDSASDSGVNLSSWRSVANVLADTTGQTKAVEIAVDGYTQQTLVYTVIPLVSADKVVGAVLIGNYLKKEVNLLKAVAVVDVILFDRFGQVMLASLPLDEKDNTTLARLMTREFYNAIVSNRSSEVLMSPRTPLGPQNYRLAYAPFILQGQTYGMMAVALSENFVTNADVTSRNLLIISFAVGIFVILVLGIVVSQWIVGPIALLVRVTQAIALGDLNQRTGLQRRDEVGILASNFDRMTAELKHKNQELEEQAGQLRAILSSMADGVVVQDAQGKVLTKNRAADKVIQKISKDGTIDEADNIDALTKLLTSLQDLAPHERRKLEIGLQTISAVAAPVTTSNDSFLGSVVVLRDITREEESEKLKDKFISSTSHELKTPLTAIKGYQAILKMLLNQAAKYLGADINERLLDNITKAEKQVNDLDNLVQSMLDVSQIEAHEFQVNFDVLNLSEVIGIVTQEWYDKMAQKGLAFEVTLPDTEVWVEGDYERLTQVLQHLVKNAHDYTLIGEVALTVTTRPQQVVITLQDTGVGVLEDDQRYLFTRFFRAIHEESTYGIAGAGLGLYLSKAIIELHHGQIQLVSKPYEGTTIEFTLPTIPAPDEDER